LASDSIHPRSRRAVRDWPRTVTDLTAMTRLLDIGEQCAGCDADLHQCLDAILDAAIEFVGAFKGNIQLLDPQRGVLRIAVQRGFDKPFLEFFNTVDTHDAAACGAAMRLGERTIIQDVNQSELFNGQPAKQVLLDQGVRAVQSTPLISSTGQVLGMVSTHFPQPHAPGERELGLIDLLARQAAEFLQRRHAEQALREKDRELETVLNSTPFMLTRCTRDLRYRYVSAACARMLGRQPDQIAGKTIVEVIGEQALATIMPHIERVLAGHVERYEATVDYAGIGPRDIQVVYTPETDTSGQVVGWVGSIMDVTERKLAEQALRDSDRRKDEFLATLAHELRNPLAPIANSLELLKRAGSDHALADESVRVMQRQLSHLVRLVDDLLDVSRISRGKLVLRKEKVQLQQIIQQALEANRPLADATQQRIRVSLPAEPVWLLGDPVRLVQVVGNLLNNACKYTRPGGQVSVFSELQSAAVVVRVIDTGIGIPPDQLQRVFELFAQAHVPGHGPHGGLGIGLSLARQLVQMHGGSIEAHSDGSDRGSEFIVRLPLAQAQG
jgi:PAS domain S-box-containing protein